MRLLRLRARGVRNLAPLDLSVDHRFVVFSGANGQGKTSALEAVWTLATLRPLRGHRLRDVIAWSADDAQVGGDVRAPDGVHQLRVDLGARRTAWLDGDEVRELPTYFHTIRAIACTPQDGAVVTEAPEERRAWLDRAAFTANPRHLDAVRHYQRCLAQKAALLREDRPDLALLDVLDEQLAGAGATLSARRDAALAELAPHLDVLHTRLAGVGRIEVVHRCSAPGATVAERAGALHTKLRQARAEELRRRTTLVGPQKDDVGLRLDGQAVRTFGSRGQVRTLVLAMKLAELVAAHTRGDRPIFLLDDLSSELDATRAARLVDLLGELDAQTLVTTTDPSHLRTLPRTDTLHVEVSDGHLRPVGGSVAPAPPTR